MLMLQAMSIYTFSPLAIAINQSFFAGIGNEQSAMQQQPPQQQKQRKGM